MVKYTYLNPIAQKGLDNFTENYEYTDNAKEADIILVRSQKMKDIEVSPNLLAVARAGAGTNNIPVEEYAKKGIFVFNTPGANAMSVKEAVFAGMYLAARDIIGGYSWCVKHAGNENIVKEAEKAKKLYAGGELANKKLGVIGLGAIGAKVATEATSMEMDVYGYDPYISIDAAWGLSSRVHHVESLTEILSICDYITIHVPLLGATRNMIDENAVAKIKRGAVLINFARDELVDEEAVVKALNAGHIRKYVSDFPNPITAGVPGVILTPHLGASTSEAEENCAIMAVRELKDFVENGNVRHCVNLPNLEMGPVRSAMRMCLVHKNQRGMIAKFAKILDDADINVSDLSNKSKDDIAYSVIDLDKKPDKRVIERILGMDDVIRARVIR